MSDMLIRAVDLCKWYGDGRRIDVLTNLSLDVRRGEKVVIVGQSGVGKSTLLHLLGALDRPSAGKVLFDGEDVSALDEKQVAEFRNREIGFIFQFHHLLPDFTAVENAMMPALIRGMPRAEAEAHAEALLRQVGLGDRLDHRPGELSGGEQQRVAIARAVMLSPRAVLADEPTGNLDPDTAEEVHHLLIDLNRQHDATLVIVTHNERLSALADRVLELHCGRVEQRTDHRR